MKSKESVIEQLLELNPSIDRGDLAIYKDYVAYVCEHGLQHILYTEDGSPFYFPDECGENLVGLDPLPETGIIHCKDCGTLVPKEITVKGRCPICAEYL